MNTCRKLYFTSDLQDIENTGIGVKNNSVGDIFFTTYWVATI
ncbi:hypothetical protein ADIS_4240 [Lunatimonas lonarensis]|uniref:Uncharacterized protein n=1 Tax=Lunatimonas lonarensis TaxID=1232681 RepID=R7ZMM4_9BACT|nr:hypothetical protein ADIS_4240 [Lunatimonas lonarensis]